MNVDKLITLVDQHAARQTNYRHLSARYRLAVNDEARQMAEMTAEADDLAEQIILLPLEKLVAVPPEEMEAAGVSLVQGRRLVAARRLVARLRSESEALAEELKQSQALTSRLVEFAAQRGELVNQ